METSADHVRAKAIQLGIIRTFGYYSEGVGHVRLRPAAYGVYMSITGDLRDIMMNSTTFDGDLYHMLYTMLGVDMLAALRMCLS